MTAPAAPAAPTTAVRDLARSLPTGELPAYLYDIGALREHAAFVRAALPEPVELYYAAKANPEPEILAALAPFVDGYEVSSGGELAHVAGVLPGRPLAFSGPGKTPAEIAAALDLGVRRFHVESEHELRVLAELAARRVPACGAAAGGGAGDLSGAGAGDRVGVLLRFDVPAEAGLLAAGSLVMGGRPTQFGIDPARADAAVRLLTDGSRPQLELLGVHAHLASGLDAPELLGVAGSVVDWATRLADRHRVALREVNVGGGMAADYTRPGVRFDWAAYGAGLARLAAARPGLVLRIEPGRALTVYCGWYVCDVLDVKHSRGEEFAVLRGGTHHLRTPAAKGHDQPCAVLPVDAWPHPWPRPAAGQDLVTLTGQLCTRRTCWPAGSGRRACAPGTGWPSPWPARTPGTSPTTTSSCILGRPCTSSGSEQAATVRGGFTPAPVVHVRVPALVLVFVLVLSVYRVRVPGACSEGVRSCILPPPPVTASARSGSRPCTSRWPPRSATPRC
ncbi:diaminopimelate decarboxylase [Streptomyces sp. DvalAA-14]|nr:diaminopimelate decarboxylase [Streptomyces sp. DvalAA-14]